MGSSTSQQNDIRPVYWTVHLSTYAWEQSLSDFSLLPSWTARRNFKILLLEDIGLCMRPWWSATQVCKCEWKRVQWEQFLIPEECLRSTFIDEWKFWVVKNGWTSVLLDNDLQVFVMKRLNLRIRAYCHKYLVWEVLWKPEKAESTTMMSLILKGAVFPVTYLCLTAQKCEKNYKISTSCFQGLKWHKM